MKYSTVFIFAIAITAGGIAILHAAVTSTDTQVIAPSPPEPYSAPLMPPPGAPVPAPAAMDTDTPVDTDRMSSEEIWMHRCPLADGFVFPVGKPDARGYYDAQPFGGRSHHLGEDWNGRGGGNSDLGDPIYSVANGIVFFAEDIQLGWGNVVRVLHNIGTREAPVFIDSLYAHFDEVHVQVGDIVTRGQQIGTMGNCDGLYAAHLHFEMRDLAFMGIGGAYAVNQDGYINPTPFLKKHLVSLSPRE